MFAPSFSAKFDPSKPLLVLDMDETLLHTDFTYDESRSDVEIVDDAGIRYYVRFGTNHQLKVNLRPHLAYFLDQTSRHYNLVLFTASEEHYASAVIKFFDPENRYFCAHLFRQHCIQSENGVSFHNSDPSFT